MTRRVAGAVAIAAAVVIVAALSLYALRAERSGPAPGALPTPTATVTATAVIFVLVSVPISFVNVLNEIAALMLLRGPEFLSVFDRHQLDALALVFLRLHSQGLFVVAGIFWGLWLLPLGLLVMRSGFAPRALGVLLILAGVAYVAVSLTSLLLPQYLQLVSTVAILFEAGEVPMIAWLLITGAKRPARAR